MDFKTLQIYAKKTCHRDTDPVARIYKLQS